MKKVRPKTFAKTKGAFGARKVGSAAPPMIFQRDYAYAMPMIFKNATILTELSYTDTEEDDEECAHNKRKAREQMEAVDTISQFYIRMYADCRIDNITGLAGWSEILDYLKADDIEDDEWRNKIKDIRGEVFGLFNSFMTLSLFTYMFSAKEMAIASPDSIDEPCFNLEAFLSVLSVMDDDTRKVMLLEARKLGIISPQVDLTALYKQGGKYLAEIKRDQEKRYEQSANSAETD